MRRGTMIDRRSLLALVGVGGLSACTGTVTRAGIPSATSTAGPRSPAGPSSPVTSTLSSSAPDPDDLKVALRALTDQMSRALRTGDRAAFLDALAPGATKARKDAGRWFDTVRTVPMTRREMAPVSGADGWELPRGTTPWTFAFVHQISGVDRAPVEEWYGAPLVRTASGIRLDGWGGVKDVDPGSDSTYVGYYRQLWDDGPVRYGAQGHAALLTDTGTGRAAHRRLLAEMDDAVSRTRAILTAGGVPVPPEPVLVTVGDTTHHKLFDYMGGQRSAPTASFVGFSCALPRLDDEHQPIADSAAVSARIVVDPEALPDSGATRALVRHESAHALLSAAWGVQDDRVPWTVEGVSQWCEIDGDKDVRLDTLRAAADAYPSRLASVDAVDYWKGDDDAVGDSYAVAYAAFDFVAETKGLRTALAMMRPGFPGGTGGDPYELGGFTDVKDFDRQLAAWLPKASG